MKRHFKSIFVALLFAIISITGVSGCGSELNSNNTDKKIKVTIPFDLSEKSLQKSNQTGNPNQFYGPAPSNVRSIRVDAVYSDGRKISGYAEVAPSTYVEVNMEVDEGSSIYFKAFAYDGPGGTGNLLYTGISSPQTLIMGMYYDIIIQMTADTGTSGTATPTVSSVSPAHGATGVPASGIITIIFSKPMDPSTINASTITGATAPVINTSGSTVTLSPTPWYSNTTYTITITTGVKDLAGNAMASPYTWSFTTGADGGGGGGGGTSLPSAFSFSLPLNGSTVSLPPTLSWADSVGETGYAIEIATNSAFTTIAHSAAVGMDTISYTVSTGLSPSITYYWRVKAINSYGTTTVSNAPFTFTTTGGGGGGGGSVPTTFSLGAPLNNSTGVSTTPTLSWTDSTGETSYAIEIATYSTFTSIVHSATVGTDIISYTVSTGLSPSIIYYWRVKAVNSYGNTLASNAPFTFTTTSGGGSAPTAFNYSLPLNNATGVSTTPTLSWADSVGETSYAIEIATDPGFTAIAHSATVGTNTISYTVPGGMLSSLTPYYWRVKAINSYGATTVSNAPYTFTT